jgi:phage shock protein C
MTSIADEVDRLAAQRAAGHLTDTEFEAAKARLFSQPHGDAWGSTASQAHASVNALRRSINDRWIGGVCGGIAKMAGIESWIVRLMFVLGILFAGLGLLPYVLLWIFVPPEGR